MSNWLIRYGVGCLRISSTLSMLTDLSKCSIFCIFHSNSLAIHICVSSWHLNFELIDQLRLLLINMKMTYFASSVLFKRDRASASIPSPDLLAAKNGNKTSPHCDGHGGVLSDWNTINSWLVKPGRRGFLKVLCCLIIRQRNEAWWHLLILSGWATVSARSNKLRYEHTILVGLPFDSLVTSFMKDERLPFYRHLEGYRIWYNFFSISTHGCNVKSTSFFFSWTVVDSLTFFSPPH